MTFSLRQVGIVQGELVELSFFRNVAVPQWQKLKINYEQQIRTYQAQDSISSEQVSVLNRKNYVSEQQTEVVITQYQILNRELQRERRRKKFYRGASAVLGIAAGVLYFMK